MRELAEKYENDCEGADITVDAHGSQAGLRELDTAGAQSKNGAPPADSLVSSFLTYIRGGGQDVIRTHGHLPCGTPVGMRICGAG